MTDRLAEIAVAYARRGRPVFSVARGGKVPASANGVKDASTDEATVRRMWRRHPGANIGLATGNGLVVVDVDGEQGHKTLADLGDLPATLAASTGNGEHLYFTSAAGLGNSVARIGVGVDTRAANGYVIAPPSWHPSGSRYAWTCRAPIAPLPGFLLELLQPKPCDRPPVPLAPIVGARSAYGAAALDRETADVAATGQGNRNHRLFQAAARLGELVAGGELDEHLVRNHLAAAATSAGLAEIEIARTIKSGIERGFLTPRRATV